MRGTTLHAPAPALPRARALCRSGLRASAALPALLLGCGLLLGPAALPAVADTSPSATADRDAGQDDGGDAAPTEAGTSFRTATALRQDQEGTASASTGDYLYWSFPADAGQRPTVRATVKLPGQARHADSTWQIEVYDGLRRRQACMYGAQSRSIAPGADSVELSCTLRPVRAWSEPWADDPLPGTYYIRLTAVDLASSDLGQPMRAETEAVGHGVDGAHAVDGKLGQPLVPGISAATASGSADGAGDDSDDDTGPAEAAGPEDGWSSGLWSDRWLWTAAGGLLAALAGIGGYRLARPAPRR